MKRRIVLLVTVVWGGVAAACGPPPKTADEVVAASLSAHGARALTNWNTMVIKGEVNRKDGRLWFRGEYIVYAQKPDKLRIETDLTKFERGRYFFSEIYNNGKGWIIQNLVPSYRDGLAERYKAKLDRCDGIAFYSDNADRFQLFGEETVETRPAYVVEATLGEETAKLYIDKESFYLLKEIYGNVTLVYSDFKRFGNTVRATSVRETTEGQRTVEIDYTYHTVEIDVPIDPALFEEEMPTG